MKKNRVSSENYTELRRHAEEHLKTEQQKIPDITASHDEMQRIIHELAVHQIELEMQQEALLQSREELEEWLERFTELYDFAPLGYFTLARDGTILQVNLTGTKLLGVERSLLVGDRLGMFVADEDLSGFNALLDRVFSSNDHHLSLEVMLRNAENFQSQADDSLFRHKELLHNRMVRIDVVVSNDGQECKAVLSDITMQKHVEKENAALQSSLVQVRKMESIGRLAAGVAHDFNTMLQVMLGKIDLLITAEGVSSSVREQLVELRMFVLKSAGLPYQLLVFARKQTIEPSVLDCNATVSNMLNMLRYLIGEDINLVFTPAKELWPVRMDPSQLDQIMINLALNSRDAIKNAGTLVIETSNVVVDDSYSLSHSESLPGEYVQLVVRDDGSGIDKEIISSIFEPFFTTKPATESWGFGLAMVYGIVRQNDGFIEVSSKDGEGTTFEIYLPRFSDDAQGGLPDREPIKAPGAEETIRTVCSAARFFPIGAN